MDSFYDNAAGAFLRLHPAVLRVFLNLGKHFLVGYLFFMVVVILLLHPVDDLAFFQAAVSDRCQHGIPVAETILFHDGLFVPRNQDVLRTDGLRLTVA